MPITTISEIRNASDEELLSILNSQSDNWNDIWVLTFEELRTRGKLPAQFGIYIDDIQDALIEFLEINDCSEYQEFAEKYPNKKLSTTQVVQKVKVHRNFSALKLIKYILLISGIVNILISSAVAIYLFSIGGLIGWGVLALLGGLIAGLIQLALANLIDLFIAIEFNTRMAYQLLEKK